MNDNQMLNTFFNSIGEVSIIEELEKEIERTKTDLYNTKNGTTKWVELSAHLNAVKLIEEVVVNKNRPWNKRFMMYPTACAGDVGDRLSILVNDCLQSGHYDMHAYDKKSPFMYGSYMARYVKEIADIASMLIINIENSVYPVIGCNNADDYCFCKMF